ncbi:[Protein-PII] uridylyltransferase / [Protein-PII]-UMP uridylyl-removing enzyme [hydrothermal vent metagenome]|uniref:[Protein-PII] uridylyltransferase / [Protein-PII]-UMP uridylyl-removing enzyme n=1 Tax=hydrothermal vent metagenome TaxID=652676 RepID=A0A3B1CN31_9ZZZZ
MNTTELKLSLDRKRALAFKKHKSGAGGLEVCRELCEIVDNVIVDLYKSGRGKFNGVLVALGGYGRGLLNPYSDIDLLFLLNDSIRGGTARPPDTLLASLWDMGLKVGHSARTISDSVKMGRADLYSRTSMMECRPLAGEMEIYDLFRKKYAREVIRYKPNNFIRDKITEMENRHRSHGRVIHITEPNIKESKGGLRDLHTALWIIHAKENVTSLEDMAARGMIDPADVEPVNNAHSYLLRLRNSLHFRAGGPADTLVHALQPDAARMENISGSDNIAAADLMRSYFEAAEIIARFSSELISFSKSYRRRWRWRPLKIDSDGLFTDGEYLHAHSFPPGSYDKGTEILFRIAKRLSDERLKPAPNLKRGLVKLRRKAPDDWFEGASGGAFLMSVLKLRRSAIAIRAFHTAGIVERLIPEFKEITNLSQFDMFHRYSVDEHTILALDNLEKIPDGAQVSSTLRHVFRAQPDMEVVKLSLLLHDLGKRAEDHHAVEKDTRTPVILKRLGLESLTETVSFLVENHLALSVTAQRRNFSAPETLRRFCAKVRSQKNLKRLYLLTYADIASVGPGVWNEWKDKIIGELYEEAEKYFIEGEALFLSKEEQMDALVRETVKIDRLKHSSREVSEFLSKAPMQYLRTAEPETIVEHLSLVERSKNRKVALMFKFNPGDQTGEITLISSERLGFFSVVAGAFAAKNVNIIETRVHTFKGRMALDTVVIEGASMSFFADPDSLAKFEDELAELLEGKRDVDEQVKRRMRYVDAKETAKSAFAEPHVLILNHLMDKNTIVEIWASDRLGLLYDVTSVMAALKLDIKSAKISTEGRLAINAFYVTEESGSKLGGRERVGEVTQALLKTIL